MATGKVHSGIMAREVERRDRRHHPERVAVRDVVHPARHVAHRLAHEEGGHPAGELDDLYAAPDLAAGVLGVLAVLQGDYVPQLLEVLLQEHLVAEQHLVRCTTGVADQSVKAAWAAFTARSRSS
jgi:hypothetical protein